MAVVKFNIGGVIVEMEKEDVSKAIETGEVKINSDNLIAKSDDQIIYSTTDFDIFKTNLSNDEYKKGKLAGSEMIVKDAREKYGLDFDGKTMDNFADAFKTKIIADSNIKPNEKINELSTDNEKLRSNYNDLEKQFDSFKTEQTEKDTRAEKDNKLLSFIPAQGLKVDRDIALMALKSKSGIDIQLDDNNTYVVTKDGNIQKDKVKLNPVDISEFITENLSSLNLVETKNGGAGGSDDNGNGSSTSYEMFVSEMDKAGHNVGSMHFTEEMNRRQKEGTLKF